ncbi:hypothetical protein GGI42DRAFT_313572 [Trichoderma sp. SZMC 28013]
MSWALCGLVLRWIDIAGAGGWVRDAGDLQRRPMIGISQMHCICMLAERYLRMSIKMHNVPNTRSTEMNKQT